MSPASQWFSKRTPKSPTSASDTFGHSVSADKLSLHSKNPDSFKFSNFASVLGRKSKKSRPTLIIPDCPVPPLVSPSPFTGHRSDSPQYTNRPSSKSISSTVRSGDDSLELRTPSDAHRDRGSLPLSVLTLSDDPFAAGVISVPQSILDRGRLSLYSSTSANNAFSNKDEADMWRRPSSASTSSQSHAGSNGIPSSEPPLSHSSSRADARSPWSSRETTRKNEIAHEPSPVECSYMDEISKASLSKCGSLSTLTGPNRKASPDSPAAAVRPTIRTTGCTEVITSRSRTVSASPSAEVSVRSRTISCQQSIPPSPCTSHISPGLPDGGAEHESPTSVVDTNSSDSISFTSSDRPMQDLALQEIISSLSRYRPYREINQSIDPDFTTLRQPVKESSRIHVRHAMESSPAPPAFHQLKKSMSHSTLQKAKLGSSSSNTSQDLCRGNAELKRQYSFHQSRHNAPSMAASNATSLGYDLSSNESRKPFPCPQAVGRKRLFSGSNRRPSTAIADEDIRSVFSLPTEAERSCVASTRAVVSLLDEPSSESLASGVAYPATEFTPQHIMSPAEMLKVEAIVQDEFDAKYGEAVRNRQRGTTPMYGTTYTKEGLSTAPTSFPRLAPPRNASNVSKGPTPTSSTRPSTAQTTSFSSLASIPPSPSTTPFRLGPPPTPRSRGRPHTAETIYDADLFNRRTSIVSFTPLSPPPPRLKRPNRPPSIMSEKVAPQRSMMRKPSFLEIADEASSYDDSFLEFDSGKESLDLS